MPLYIVQHSYPLTDAHRDDLAARITSIHTKLFSVPSAFVNVNFQPYDATPHYVAGKRRTGSINMIIANIRVGPNRTRDHFETLCRQLDDAWIQAIVGVGRRQSDATEAQALGAVAKLQGVFVLGNVTAAYEAGFMVPEAGKDKEWIKENLAEFKKLADAGHSHAKEMIEELKNRDDFAEVF